jgi:hypothetical protein
MCGKGASAVFSVPYLKIAGERGRSRIRINAGGLNPSHLYILTKLVGYPAPMWAGMRPRSNAGHGAAV